MFQSSTGRIQSANYFNLTASRPALKSTITPGNNRVLWQPSLVWADSVTPQTITRQWELLSGTSPESVVPFSTPSSHIPLIKPGRLHSASPAQPQLLEKRSEVANQHDVFKSSIQHDLNLIWRSRRPLRRRSQQRSVDIKKAMNNISEWARFHAICRCNKRCWHF